MGRTGLIAGRSSVPYLGRLALGLQPADHLLDHAVILVMTGLDRMEVTHRTPSAKCQISDAIEKFVPCTLVGGSQTVFQDALWPKNQQILRSGTLTEAPGF